MNFYDMKLGDSFWHSGIGCKVVRVPGGWLFQTADSSQSSISSMSFVPFNNEFMENSAPVELATTTANIQRDAITLLKRVEEKFTPTNTPSDEILRECYTCQRCPECECTFSSCCGDSWRPRKASPVG